MQVKKFEAKSMKDALQLVKQELGPEAIILSAKDNKKSFGLAGKGSVEVTAAISTKSLQRKQYAESQLPVPAKERFKTQSAKNQKTFIENTVNKYHTRRREAEEMEQTQPSPRRMGRVDTSGLGATARRPMTTRRYIDIGDDESAQQAAHQEMEMNDGLRGRNVDDLLQELTKPAAYFIEEKINAPALLKRPTENTEEMLSLKKEVDALRDLLSQFQKGTEKQTTTRHPGADYDLPFEFSHNFEKLQQAGIDVRYIVEILTKANEELSGMEKKKSSLVDAWVARYIMSHTSVVGGWTKPNLNCQLQLFVGPGGHGKTNALVKAASQLALHEKKKIAIFTADTFKVGAADQLRIYSQILGLPFEVIKHSSDFSRLMQHYAGYDAIMVDYPGFSLKEMDEIDAIRTLIPPRELPRQTHLVLSCASKDLDAYEACHRYQVTHFDDLLVTKIDESHVHGLLYNLQRKTEKPLYAFGLGQKIPEDIELATRERVLDLIYKITKMGK